MNPFSPPLLAVVALWILPLAHGALLTVTNSGFETPNTANGSFNGSQTTGPSGWSVYNTAPTNSNRFFGVWDPTGTLSYTLPLPQGQQVGVVFLDDTLGFEAGLVQTLTATLQASTHYTLNVAVGNFAPSAGDPWNFTGFPGYRVELLVGGIVMSTDNNTLAPTEGQFLTSTVEFITGPAPANQGQSLGIRLVSLNGTGVEVNFDAVTLDATPIPEPASTVTLLGAAALALTLARRRR